LIIIAAYDNDGHSVWTRYLCIDRRHIRI